MPRSPSSATRTNSRARSASITSNATATHSNTFHSLCDALHNAQSTHHSSNSTTTPLQLPAYSIVPANGDTLLVLDSPHQFYSALLEGIAKTQDRILIASLYLGTDDLCHRLVHAIHRRLLEKPCMQVTFLLDALRATRPVPDKSNPSASTSSLRLLAPLLEAFPDRCTLFLYHTPKLSGWLKKMLPPRANEVIGVQHIKAYIFDNELIMSGINILHQGKIEMSFGVKGPKHELVLKAGVPNPYREPTLWCSHAAAKFSAFLNSRRKEEHNWLSSKTWIFPTLQVGPAGIRQDSEITQRVLSGGCTSRTNLTEMTISSPYFNLTKEYQEAVLARHATNRTNKTNIIVAAPSASGFYNSKGLSYYIPALYSKCMKKELGLESSISLAEYSREKWTFHGKGVWLNAPQGSVAEDQPIVLTLMGSPNFSSRSVELDLESQLVVVTQDPNLAQRLEQEKADLEERNLPSVLKYLHQIFLHKYM